MDAATEELDDGLVSVRANVGLAGGIYPGRYYRVDPASQYVIDCLREGRLTLAEEEGS